MRPWIKEGSMTQGNLHGLKTKDQMEMGTLANANVDGSWLIWDQKSSTQTLELYESLRTRKNLGER